MPGQVTSNVGLDLQHHLQVVPSGVHGSLQRCLVDLGELIDIKTIAFATLPFAVDLFFRLGASVFLSMFILCFVLAAVLLVAHLSINLSINKYIIIGRKKTWN